MKILSLLILISALTIHSTAYANETNQEDPNETLPWLTPSANIIATLIFSPQEDTIASDANEKLLATTLAFLNENNMNRIQIDAYASPREENPSKARQASLKRAISIRKRLINNGISTERIIVRALGSNTAENQDRADIFAL